MFILVNVIVIIETFIIVAAIEYNSHEFIIVSRISLEIFGSVWKCAVLASVYLSKSRLLSCRIYNKSYQK